MAARGWALVTGGSRRLGRTLAVRAAAAGYDVAVHSRAGDAEDTAAEIRSLGRAALTPGADLADPVACGRLIAELPAPPTLLVNCASVFEDDRIETLEAAGLDRAFAVNARAPILLSQAFARALPRTAEGQIVNILDQKVLHPDPRFFSYTVSRAAMWAATRMTAQALAPRIRVNAIGPGPTLRSVHQSEAAFAAEAAGTLLGHEVSSGDIARAFGYLIATPSVTGQLLAVDSGQNLGWRTPDVIDE